LDIIYVEPDEDIRDLYAMKLEADFGAKVMAYSNAEDALKAISECKPENAGTLLLIDGALWDSSADSLYQHVVKQRHIPFVILSDKDSPTAFQGPKTFQDDHAGNRLIKKPVQASLFQKTLVEVLEHTQFKGNWLTKAEYGHSRVKITNFLKFNVLPCDAFIRIGDLKFVKLINKEDMYTTEVIKKYIQKGVDSLYVAQEDYPVLANTGIRSLISLYDRRGDEGGQGDLQLSSLEQIHTSLQDIGLTKESAELTKKTIVSAARLCKRQKSVADLLNKMKASGNYIYDHSLKLSYICTAIAKHTEWGSDATIFKLGLAATMHDMTLENPDLARVQSQNDPALEKFTKEEVEKYRMHPLDAAKLIKDQKMFPPDIDFIVAQHHERPDGSGFPRGLSKLRIAPLSCLFILGHEFVTKIENMGGAYNKENRDRAYDEMNQDMFTMGNFKKPFLGLQKAFNQMSTDS